MKRVLAWIFCFIAAIAVAQTNHDQNQSPFTLKKLTENVYALYGRGGNIGFFVGPDSVVVVDSQFLDLAPGIVEKSSGKTKEEFLKEFDLPKYKDWDGYKDRLAQNAGAAWDTVS